MENLVKSPLNYTGGKFKLLPQILPLFPKDIDTFVDLFGGGFNVGINVKANRIVYNDSMKVLSDLFKYWENMSSDIILQKIDSIIEFYELSNTTKNGYEFYGCNSSQGVGKYNREKFFKLRDAYNKDKDIELFYPLVVFAFNNQIRFNSDGDFNIAVNKRDFNKNIRKNLVLFLDKLFETDVTFLNSDFQNIKLMVKPNDLVYIDPPYLNTTATYNEQDGWCEAREKALYDKLDSLDANNRRFAMSNVLDNKGVKNELLTEWSKKYTVHYLNHSYGNSSYQAKDKSKDSTVEVLITNY